MKMKLSDSSLRRQYNGPSSTAAHSLTKQPMFSEKSLPMATYLETWKTKVFERATSKVGFIRNP